MQIGQKLGPYEIIAKLGEGGMGEVYRARDSRLKRDVAIKVLPADVANDRERLARFQREAEVLASLNHPHIAHVYGIEENALVMELVEGEDLSQRIMRGAVPVDEALPMARQIAEALEAAHDAGVIHRDLKPANVKARSDGALKVLDFGLAKAIEPVSSSANLAHSPTITSPDMTRQGVILGTAAYMSPEQAKGRPVDRRADIWAFGCVLYEMLTGRRAFTGDDVTDIITSVMRDAPNWNALPPTTPPALRRLLHRCLEKDVRKRLPHIGVARLDIDEAATSSSELLQIAPAPAPALGRRRMAAVVAVATIVLAAASWAAGRYIAPVPADPMPLRFTVDAQVATPFTARATAFVSVSPDGTRMVFFGQPRGRVRQLYVHSFTDGSSRALNDTDGATAVFWSPDSKTIAFYNNENLQRLELANGTVQTICDKCAAGVGGAWNKDGIILFGNGPLYQVAASGGTPTAITTVNAASGELRHERPRFLPDGRHFIFVVINGDRAKSALVYGELGSSRTRILGNIASGADYVEPGFLLYAKDGKLIARAFDAVTGEWRGEPTIVSETIRQQAVGTAAFSASPNGVVAFDSVPIFAQQIEIVWMDRAGQVASTFSTTEAGHTIALAPNGIVAAVEQTGSIWIVDAERGTRTRLSLGNATQGHPVWSPDSKRVGFFAGDPGAVTQLFIKAVNGTGDAEPLVGSGHQTNTSKQPTDWSKDGRYFIFEEQTAASGWDINYVDLAADRRPLPLLNGPFNERLAQVSPDGKFVAYESTETGTTQIYVSDFPNAKERWPMSTQGGFKPRWHDNGRELVYVDPAGMLQSVAVKFEEGINAAPPAPLFEQGGIDTDGLNYAMSHDGSRFLVVRLSRTAPSPRLSVIVNWPATLPPH